MTKHLLKSWLFLSLFALFLSCRNEYLVNDDFKNQTTTARQIRFEDLKQIPNLIGKISEIKSNQKANFGKLYTDSLNSFTIDTDYGLLIEDENQNKTYTFKIERNPSSPLFENLVLKDIGNGEYEAYISQYDNAILQKENPTNNDVNNHFQINYVGKKGDEVFGKYATCTYTITSTFYVPGVCTGHGHQTGDPDCTCNGTNCQPAGPGYNATQYTTIYYDCESGTSGSGDPNGGGVSGGSDPGDVPTSPYPNTNNNPSPCVKIVSENTKVKTIFTKSIISAKNTTMKATITTDTIEKAFIFGKNDRGVDKTSDIINGVNGYNVQMPSTHDDFTVEGGFHNHTNEVYEVPSPGDIYWFMHNNSDEPSFQYYFTNGALGSSYVYVITNPTDFNNFATTYPQSTYFDSTTTDWKSTESIGIDAEKAYKYFKDTQAKSDEESMELAMAFVIGKYDMGLGISKKDSSGDFQPIFVKEIIDPTDSSKKTYEKTTDCNLK